jgi:phosphoglycerate dehydrogenase-like enzyme
MKSTKPRVYIHRTSPAFHKFYMSDDTEALLLSFADVVSDGERDTPLSEAEQVERMRGCSAILSLRGGAPEITAEVMKAVGTIKIVCIAHWCEQLAESAKACGITVTEGSNANTVAVAEWTLTAALMGIRKLNAFDKALNNQSSWAEPRLSVGMLSGSTVGLVGLGRIGWYCANLFRTLGARVIAHDKYWTKERGDELGVTLVTIGDLMQSADVISLHLPVTAETKGLLSASDFALIKDGAVFINSARAALYDEEALVAELQKNRFSAFLDVFSEEPLPLDHPFRSMDNVLITPHIAGDNAVMYQRCGCEAVETLRDYFVDNKLRNLQYSFNRTG